MPLHLALPPRRRRRRTKGRGGKARFPTPQHGSEGKGSGWGLKTGRLGHDKPEPGVGGTREGMVSKASQYSIRINDQWRICFEWPEGSLGPLNVEIVDYHYEVTMARLLIHPGEYLADELSGARHESKRVGKRIGCTGEPDHRGHPWQAWNLR